MKRSMDLVLAILKLAEALPPGEPLQDYSPILTHHSEQEIIEHIDLAIKAGLLEGRVLRGLSGGSMVNVTRLTNAGHDLLAEAGTRGVWERAKTATAKAGGEMTITMMKAAVHASYEMVIAEVKRNIQGG